ncbi:PREDICTED: caspase-1-like isoform X2 [Ceratosolen solmsi marchali]|uniref:Caspase-1-like isoform X2 n=1 Tax=Ceratosolen solmsi marchali TaxID=326594 RepID=A0AAJ6YJX2_9HYME|nr:PREDICTED: caspase-1-like isoform X2 [Ceratosolen solmsi marchali]
MSKRKCEYDSDIQMSDFEDSHPLRTPGRGKRRQRVSDVIDSMGDRGDLGSPAISAHRVTATTTSATAPGFVTPQRTSAYWNLAISPDQGYSTTPELDRSYSSNWRYNKINSHDAFVRRGDEDNYSFSSVEILGKLSSKKDADCYNMNHRNRGKCIIFNHEHFDMGFETREGSSADARRIELTFQGLGFTVEICDDYEHSSIINKINKLSEEDHTENDCICIFVLTHGLQNDFICAKDVVYKLDSIWKPFTADRCSTLAGKPKLFFFQACRGDKLDGGVKMQRSGTTETDSSTTSYKIPTHADFLFAHSTVEGFFSWRNPEEGTWFVQSLCDVIDKHASTTDLSKMLTMTARKVATDFASYNNLDPTLHDQKQVPSVTSMLIRDLYFSSKNG